MKSKYTIYKETVKKLHEEKKSTGEIAKIIDIDARRVSDLLKQMGLKAYTKSEVKEDITINKEQEQVLIGGLMGDMCIFKDKKANYHRMNCAHGLKQKKYLLYKYEMLKNLFNEPKTRSWIDKRNGKEYSEIKIQSKTHPFFTELYNRWYFNGIKYVSDDFAKIEPLGLAIWFMDDGYKSISNINNPNNTDTIYSYDRYEIATNSFSARDFQFMKEVLKEKFNLEISLQPKTKAIYFKTNSKKRFVEIISPYVINLMEYKL